MSSALPDAHFFRHQYARLVAVLVRRFGVDALETIEDAAQGALERAVRQWAGQGVPTQPEAWLVTVARNLVLDELRRRRKLAIDPTPHLEEPAVLVGVGQHAATLGAIAAAAIEERNMSGLDDLAEERDQLRLLFACASELVPERSRLVLCLKLVAGFGTREIASRLFTSDANVQKLLERGRVKLREAWAGLSTDDVLEGGPTQLEDRIALVEHVIYLIFNEGYSSERPDAPLRPDLCDDALALTQALVRATPVPRGSTLALLALMHFLRARLLARVDERGQLVMLSRQERALWDGRHIQLGVQCLAAASSRPRAEFSRYHGEALIQAEHCLAPTFEATRWDEIVELYTLLEQGYPSPLYVLSRAIAVAEWKGPAAGIEILDQNAPPSWLAGHYLFVGTRGELERRRGNFAVAISCLREALEVTPTKAERAIFSRRLEWAMSRRTEPEPDSHTADIHEDFPA